MRCFSPQENPQEQSSLTPAGSTGQLAGHSTKDPIYYIDFVKTSEELRRLKKKKKSVVASPLRSLVGVISLAIVVPTLVGAFLVHTQNPPRVTVKAPKIRAEATQRSVGHVIHQSSSVAVGTQLGAPSTNTGISPGESVPPQAVAKPVSVNSVTAQTPSVGADPHLTEFLDNAHLRAHRLEPVEQP